ncbi:MAG: M48 family metalloprotease [Spirochaetales bacterium]|nr:M48 family metalloprotease [Spirochaetales bacterium]
MKTRRFTAAALLPGILLPGILLLAGCSSLGGSLSLGNVFGALTSTEGQALIRSFEDFTPEQEYYIGRAVGATVLDQYRPYDREEVNEYLNLLGQTLALASERPEIFGGYHFLALDSDQINAFATPSGLVFVSRGLLRCAGSEDEVAAILAHEIGHVVGRHGMKAIKTSRIQAAATDLALSQAEQRSSAVVARLTAAFSDSIKDITSTMINSGYSRTLEKEADLSALRTLRAAGYDPWALVRMLKVMDQRLTPGGPDFAKTHPDPAERLEYLEKELAGTAPSGAAPAERQARYRAALAGI